MSEIVPQLLKFIELAVKLRLTSRQLKRFSDDIGFIAELSE